MATPSSSRFTDTQGQYLAFIHAYALVNGRPPAEADIARTLETTALQRRPTTVGTAGLWEPHPQATPTVSEAIQPRFAPLKRGAFAPLSPPAAQMFDEP